MSWQPPPYPYDRLNELKVHGERFDGGLIDLSIGTPFDAPPDVALVAMASSDAERGYPPSIGLPAVRHAASDWLQRRFGAEVPASHIAATIGTKEFVVSVPRYLALRSDRRDTVLYPEISYPSYAMGAELAGLRSVAVPVDSNWCLDLSAVDAADVERALCLWVNTPGNPAGGLDDLAAIAEWSKRTGVTVLSDECYIEFTWDGRYRTGETPGATLLAHTTDNVISLHSLSKRSNFAGARFGFFAGDPELVHFLSEVRKHAGNMVPGPVQHGAIAALGDDVHVEAQRQRYEQRLSLVATQLTAYGIETAMPDGGFYLWVPAPDGDAWAFVAWLAREVGVLASPGEFYGVAGSGHIRLAMVASTDQLQAIEARLGQAAPI